MSTWKQDWESEAKSGNLANDLAGLELIGLDEDLDTLNIPADTTISAFMKTLLDDTDASSARSTLEVLGSSGGTSYTEFIRPTSYTVPIAELGGHILNNYGQADISINYWLPVATEALRFDVVIGTARAGRTISIIAASSNKIYLDGVAGVDGECVQVTPAVGYMISFISVKTGVGAWDWIAITRAGVWTATSVDITRITSTGDTRVTSDANTRVIAH